LAIKSCRSVSFSSSVQRLVFLAKTGPHFFALSNAILKRLMVFSNVRLAISIFGVVGSSCNCDRG
jgi:hypothetical protein